MGNVIRVPGESSPEEVMDVQERSADEDRRAWPWGPLPPAGEREDAAGRWPRISIVTPSFNQGRYLEETIRSVLAQEYPKLQYVVIDGGSNDGSVEILRKYADHLDHWESEPDRGQAHALNKGFARCDGEIFAYLNSDDLYRPGALERVARAFREHPDPARFLWASAVEDFDETGVLTRIGPRTQNQLADWIGCRAYLHQPGVFWSADLHRRIGGFDEELEYAFDRNFFVAALLEGARIEADPATVTARFRRHPESKTEAVAHSGRGFATEFHRVSRWTKENLSLRQRLEWKIVRRWRAVEPTVRRARVRLGAIRLAIVEALFG